MCVYICYIYMYTHMRYIYIIYTSIFIYIYIYKIWASQVALVVNNLPANAEDVRDVSLIPGSGRAPEEGMATYFSILTWRIPWTEEPDGLRSIGSQRIRQYWSDLACMHPNIIYILISLYNSKIVEQVVMVVKSPWLFDSVQKWMLRGWSWQCWV